MTSGDDVQVEKAGKMKKRKRIFKKIFLLKKPIIAKNQAFNWLTCLVFGEKWLEFISQTQINGVYNFRYKY